MALREPVEQVLSCSCCGADNRSFASFCIHCGEPLDGDSGGFSPLASVPESSAVSVDLGPRSLSALQPRPSPRRNLARRETALGMLVLLLALGYALYYWQQSAVQSSAFRAGAAAERARDWDRAAAEFARAGDRRDADLKEQEALRKITERNRLYTEGARASDRQEWSAAISALQGVQSIQPAYRDSAVRLSRAMDSAYREGLAGLVYLVDGGSAPGLYMRDASGRVSRLPGSDGSSVLRAVAPDGKLFVYDRPSVEADYYPPSLSHNSPVQDFFGLSATDRVPVLAQIGQGGIVSTYALPQLPRTGRGTFTPGGLWWYNSLSLIGTSNYLYYLSLETLEVARVVGKEVGTRVIALDPPRSRVVLAEEILEPVSGITETRVYLSDAAGNNRRLLRTAKQSTIQQASISPDGHWLLKVTQEEASRSLQSVWVVPLDVDSQDSRRRPLETTRLTTLSYSELDNNVRLSAAFVPSERHSSRVVVSKSGPGGETMFVFAVEEGKASWIASASGESSYTRNLSAFSHDGRYLASRRQASGGVVLEVVGLHPGSAGGSTVRLDTFNQQQVRMQFSPRDDYMTARVQYPGGTQVGAQNLYALPVESGGSLGGPKLLGQMRFPSSRDLPTMAMPGDGSLLVYVDPANRLHALFYDGAAGAALVDNVRAVWSLKGPPSLTWWK